MLRVGAKSPVDFTVGPSPPTMTVCFFVSWTRASGHWFVWHLVSTTIESQCCREQRRGAGASTWAGLMEGYEDLGERDVLTKDRVLRFICPKTGPDW